MRQAHVVPATVVEGIVVSVLVTPVEVLELRADLRAEVETVCGTVEVQWNELVNTVLNDDFELEQILAGLKPINLTNGEGTVLLPDNVELSVELDRICLGGVPVTKERVRWFYIRAAEGDLKRALFFVPAEDHVHGLTLVEVIEQLVRANARAARIELGPNQIVLVDLCPLGDRIIRNRSD